MRKKIKCLNQNKGFTLLEMVVVLAIMMTIISLGGIGLKAVQDEGRVRAVSDETRNLLKWARELSLANKSSVNYQMRLESGMMVVEAVGGGGKKWYQVERGVEILPESLEWGFAPITGEATGCSVCEITIMAGRVQETILIGEGGIVR